MYLTAVGGWQVALLLAGTVVALALLVAWLVLLAYRPRHTHAAIAANRVSVQLRRSR